MDDESGYRDLFRVEYPRLVRELSVIIGADVAEDIAADAFEELLRKWSRIRDYERPGAWVRLVALRAAGKARRRRDRRFDIESGWVPAAGDPPLDLDLLRALAVLTFHQRAAVVLHHLGGFSASDIGSILNCEPATVRTHLFRGRRRLAALLDETTEEEIDAG